MHRQTPFAQIAARHEAILFVDGEDVVGLKELDGNLRWNRSRPSLRSGSAELDETP
jgi:hypothetical protein